MKPKIKVNKTVIEDYVIYLTRQHILNLLDLPDNAEITFMVPRGGDYSGCEVDISNDDPIIIRYKNIK